MLSTTLSILLRSIAQNTLLGTESSVIPLQLSHMCRSLFWEVSLLGPCSNHVVWSNHDCGMVSFSHMYANKLSRMFGDVKYLGMDGVNARRFPIIYSDLMAVLTSSIVGGLLPILCEYSYNVFSSSDSLSSG